MVPSLQILSPAGCRDGIMMPVRAARSEKKGGAMSDQLRREVLELYREVDAAVAEAGPVCVASGRCCRFQEFGHVLYLSSLEAEVLLAGAPPHDPNTVT